MPETFIPGRAGQSRSDTAFPAGSENEEIGRIRGIDERPRRMGMLHECRLKVYPVDALERAGQDLSRFTLVATVFLVEVGLVDYSPTENASFRQTCGKWHRPHV